MTRQIVYAIFLGAGAVAMRVINNAAQVGRSEDIYGAEFVPGALVAPTMPQMSNVNPTLPHVDNTPPLSLDKDMVPRKYTRFSRLVNAMQDPGYDPGLGDGSKSPQADASSNGPRRSRLVGRPHAVDRRQAFRKPMRHNDLAMLQDPSSDPFMRDLASNTDMQSAGITDIGLQTVLGAAAVATAPGLYTRAKRLLQGITDLPIQDITEEVFRPIRNPPWTAIQTNPYPDENPLTEYDMKRTDEQNDGVFYSSSRFVYHIDEGAREALTNYYQTAITESNLDILDMCSSWVSHYPGNFKQKMNTIVGTGMNAEELDANKQLSSSVVRDLNLKPDLPFPDSSFDVVTLVVSVDYLTSPLEVFREVNRVLKPGGRFIISQSNRCFPTKAVAIWLRMGEINRLRLIGSYLHFAGGFSEPKAFDISAKGTKVKRNREDLEPWESDREPFDPMYIVEATKL